MSDLLCDNVTVACRARNVELIESRPDLPRQTYQHCTKTNTRWNKSASLDRCNTQPSNQYTASAVSGQHCSRPPAASLSSTNFKTPSNSLDSRTSSKNSVSSRDRESTEDVRPSYEKSQTCLTSCGVRSSYMTGCTSSENFTLNRGIPSYHNTTQSSSSSSYCASSTAQQLQFRNGQLLSRQLM